MTPHGQPPVKRGQKISAEKILVTSDGRPVPLANVLINSWKNDAMSMYNSWSAFIYIVDNDVIVYTKT